MKHIMIFWGVSCLTGVGVAACGGDNNPASTADAGGDGSGGAGSGATSGASSGSGSSGTASGTSSGAAADAGPMIMCMNKSACTGSQICCVSFNGGISVGCQAGPCMNIPTVGSIQPCATDAECFNAGDTCGMLVTPVMTVMACVTPDGGARDSGHSDAPTGDAPASDAPASDAAGG
jgi:hypothetical protein